MGPRRGPIVSSPNTPKIEDTVFLLLAPFGTSVTTEVMPGADCRLDAGVALF